MRETTKVIKEMRQLAKDMSEGIKARKANLKIAQMKAHETHLDAAYAEAATNQWKLVDERVRFRHFHIAKCELRGTPREKIETPSDDNQPNEDIIQKIKDEWKTKFEEAVRIDKDRFASGAASGSVCTLSE